MAFWFNIYWLLILTCTGYLPILIPIFPELLKLFLTYISQLNKSLIITLIFLHFLKNVSEPEQFSVTLW